VHELDCITSFFSLLFFPIQEPGINLFVYVLICGRNVTLFVWGVSDKPRNISVRIISHRAGIWNLEPPTKKQ